MVLAQSARGPLALILVALARDVLENDRRQYAVKAVTAEMHASLLAVGGLCRPYACPTSATTTPSPLHPLYPTKPRVRTARTNAREPRHPRASPHARPLFPAISVQFRTEAAHPLELCPPKVCIACARMRLARIYADDAEEMLLAE